MSTSRTVFSLALCAAIVLSVAQLEAHGRRDCCPPPPPQKVVLVVCHPCTKCKHEVAVCIPACCQGTPNVCFERTILGAGKSVYEWSCGHTVVVRYHHDGGYRVLQRG